MRQLRTVPCRIELAACIEEGYEAMAVFIIQMKDVRYMMPNDKMDPEFGNALRTLSSRGRYFGIDCSITEDTTTPGSLVEVRLPLV